MCAFSRLLPPLEPAALPSSLLPREGSSPPRGLLSPPKKKGLQQKELAGVCRELRATELLARLCPLAPHPALSVPAAAFSRDSFYDFKAQGYEAQHTPRETWVCSGRMARERAAGLGIALQRFLCLEKGAQCSQSCTRAVGLQGAPGGGKRRERQRRELPGAPCGGEQRERL